MSNKFEQELACAQAFVNWLGPVQGVIYELKRADIACGGRWDFVAQKRGSEEWLGIEIKSLVISEDNRQFNSWDTFLAHVSSQLPARVGGSYLVLANIPWTFKQQEAKDLIEPFVEALAELESNLEEGELENLGPGIAARFSKWPTDPPIIDQKRSLDMGKCEFTYPAKDLWVSKVSSEGSSVESLPSGQPFSIHGALVQVMHDILKPDKRGQVKANIQLTEAKSKGASNTVLLLDTRIACRSTEVRWAFAHCVDVSLMPGIDAVYLVGVGGGRVEPVWNSKRWSFSDL